MTQTTDSFLAHKKAKFLQEKSKHWELFYKRNSNHFFKDRHWTDREFQELLPAYGAKTLLEVGCGHGSFIFPLLSLHPTLSIFACDFSSRAVELVKENVEFDETRITAFVADITQQSLCPPLSPNSMDLVSCIFVFSAMQPDHMAQAAKHLQEILSPGGVILFRDYALNDLAQKRFKQDSNISENLYYRQDGTLSYFFTKQVLREIFESAGLVITEMEYVVKKVVNRKQELEMERIFLQAKIQKPLC